MILGQLPLRYRRSGGQRRIAVCKTESALSLRQRSFQIRTHSRIFSVPRM